MVAAVAVVFFVLFVTGVFLVFAELAANHDYFEFDDNFVVCLVCDVVVNAIFFECAVDVDFGGLSLVPRSLGFAVAGCVFAVFANVAFAVVFVVFLVFPVVVVAAVVGALLRRMQHKEETACKT